MKITEEIINQMKELRQQGLSYGKISIKLKVSITSVLYYLNKDQREKIKKRAKEFYYNLPKDKKEIRNKKLRESLFKKYNEDKDYREKKREYQRKYSRERQKNRHWRFINIVIKAFVIFCSSF